jgi:predicted transcriptional regulator
MVRLTLEFSEDIDQLLRDLARAENIDKYEVIRRALALYQYLHKEATEEKHKLQIADKQGRVLENIVFR